MPDLPNPESRVEQYLANLTDGTTEIPKEPESRIEQYLDYLAKNGGAGVNYGTAPAAAAGMALVAKTIVDGKVTEWEFGDAGGLKIHICTSSEYGQVSREPVISSPDEKTLYLVPAENGSSPDLFVEWAYVNGNWEMFGSASIGSIPDSVNEWLTEHITNPDNPPLDRSLTSSSAAAPADLVGEELTNLKQDLSDIEYVVYNLTPHDESKVTVQYATLEISDYSHAYKLKATGYGSATPRLTYALSSTPDISSSDVMYLSFEMYIDAEASEYTANLYQPKSFGHNFGNTPIAAKQWVKVQQKYTQGSTINATGFFTGVQFSSTSVATNKIIYIRNMVSVNLTKTYGAGKEPTVEEMNAIVSANDGYFEKLNLFNAKQVVDDVSKLKSDMQDVWHDAFVDFTNGYIAAHSNDKNQGENYVSNGSGTSVTISGGISSTVGDIIYAYGEFQPYSSGDNCESISADNNTGMGGEVSASVSNPENGVWYPLSGRIVSTASISSVKFVARWSQSTSIRIYSRHIVAINLTNVFGAGNEPTKETLDKYFYAASVSNAMDYGTENAKMLNLATTSRRLVHPYGSYVRLDNEGNVKMGSVPDDNWSGWSEIGQYGQFNKAAIPIYNKVHGTLETDGMFSVLPIWGAWSEAASSQNTHHGGHVFHGWTTDRQHRLTMVQNIYSDNEAAVFNYIPGDKSETNEGVFLPLRLGADNVYKGLLLEPLYNPENLAQYRMTRATVYGRLNISKPQNYNNVPASADAPGEKGDICVDDSYIYVCTATDTWKRVALSAWT